MYKMIRNLYYKNNKANIENVRNFHNMDITLYNTK